MSIVVCTLDRTPRLWRGVRTVRVEQPAPFFDLRLADRAAFVDVEVPDDALATVLRRRRFKVQAAADGEATFTYGDRNRYFKMATLLTHLGLILFLVGGAVTGAFGFETAVFVGEAQTAPVQPVGTPGQLAGQEPRLRGADPSRRLVRRLPDGPGGLPRRSGDRAQDRSASTTRSTVDGFVFHQNSFGAAETLRIRDADGKLVWSAPVLMDSQLLGKPQGFLTIPGSSLGLFVDPRSRRRPALVA